MDGEEGLARASWSLKVRAIAKRCTLFRNLTRPSQDESVDDAAKVTTSVRECSGADRFDRLPRRVVVDSWHRSTPGALLLQLASLAPRLPVRMVARRHYGLSRPPGHRCASGLLQHASTCRSCRRYAQRLQGTTISWQLPSLKRSIRPLRLFQPGRRSAASREAVMRSGRLLSSVIANPSKTGTTKPAPLGISLRGPR